MTGRWTFDFGAGGYRAFVSPMNGDGAPYRLTVAKGDDEKMTSVGVPTVERAVESAVTFLRTEGVSLPAGARIGWEKFARSIDRAETPA